MKKQILSLALTLAVLLAFVPNVPAAAAAFAPITGWDMMEKLGLGITFANTTEARHWPGQEPWVDLIDMDLAWGQPRIEQWHFQSAALKGFDSYRMCVSWTPQMDENYVINKAWLDKIQQMVDWALDAGMNVLLNTHHEEELYWLIRDGEYEKAKTHLTALWKQVAERFKDYPETLLFEIMNEPNLLEHYGGPGEWITVNGEVSQELCDTVSKLNTDALETIRKSGGNNGKRVVVFCVPGAHTDALPYMEAPDNDPYIMLGTFGYDDFINETKYPLVQAWLDKGVGFVNKEDQPGYAAFNPIPDLLKYTKQHFGDLAGMGIPSFWFASGRTAPYDEGQLIDRTTGEWVNKPLLEAYFAAYGKTPGADYVPTPAFPYEINDIIKPDTPTWFTIPAIELAAAEKMVVETNEKLNWFQFESMSSDEWKGFQSGNDRVTEEDGKLTLDLRGLNLSSLGFRTGNGDDNKVKRVYIDAWTGSGTPNLSTASGWARDSITSAVSKGFVPADLQGRYTNTITRAEFCRLAVKWVEYKTGKAIDEVMKEKGVTRDPKAFTDTNDQDILAAFALGITSGAGDNKFNPNGAFTREQAAGMIKNVCAALGQDVDGSPPAGFNDAGDISAWTVDGVNYCVANGIMRGGDGNLFSPKGTFTREMSIMTFDNMK